MSFIQTGEINETNKHLYFATKICESILDQQIYNEVNGVISEFRDTFITKRSTNQLTHH